MKIGKMTMILMILVFALSLTGCITVKEAEMGKDTGVDCKWETLEERFDILRYVPELADKADYFCVISSGNNEGVDIGFKEIENPEKYARKLIAALEDAGYEYDGDSCATNWGRCSEEERTENHYNCMNYSLKVDEKYYSRVNIFIEYFDNLYPNSHNVFLKITPKK